MTRPARPDDLVVFLGPSLPSDEARRLAPCRVLPPARQGDVWRALAAQPRAIALVDGVFEQAPSVWHRELLDALDAGVAVFGAASMGALRAAELSGYGMVGIGRIFAWYRDGVLVDDSEVALLHAGPEHGHRGFTVPLVNVRHNAARARAAGALTRREAAALVRAAEAVFYQERTWPDVIGRARWSPAARSRFERWSRSSGLEDLKQLDARACVARAARFVGAGAPRPRRARPLAGEPSHARRRRILEGVSVAGGKAIESRRIVQALGARADAAAMTDRGLARALLAGWARELGLAPAPGDVVDAEAAWLEGRSRRAALSECGLDEKSAARLVEELALEQLLLDEAARLISDGPSALEALANEARASGAWAAAARALARHGRRR